jgi:hypothetical protein
MGRKPDAEPPRSLRYFDQEIFGRKKEASGHSKEVAKNFARTGSNVVDAGLRRVAEFREKARSLTEAGEQLRAAVASRPIKGGLHARLAASIRRPAEEEKEREHQAKIRRRREIDDCKQRQNPGDFKYHRRGRHWYDHDPSIYDEAIAELAKESGDG